MTPLSRIEQILYSYKNGDQYSDKPLSRIEAIALNLLFDTNYVLVPSMSRIENELIHLDTYDGDKLSRIEEILDSIFKSTTYNGNILSRIEEDLLDIEPTPKEWRYEPILDNLGNPILDNTGDALIGRVRMSN